MKPTKEKMPIGSKAVNEVVENSDVLSVVDGKIKTDISMESNDNQDATIDDSGFEAESERNSSENTSRMDTSDLQNNLENDSGIENDKPNSNDKAVSIPVDVNEVIELVENLECATVKGDMKMNDSIIDTDSSKNLTENLSEICNSDSEIAKDDTIVGRDLNIDDESSNIMMPTENNISNPITESMDFECLSCMTVVNTDNGIILKNCLHEFCKECLLNTVQNTTDFVVKCPLMVDNIQCNAAIQPEELKEINNLENACGVDNKNLNTPNEGLLLDYIIPSFSDLKQNTVSNTKELNEEQIPLQIWSPTGNKQKKKKAVASTPEVRTTVSSLMNELVYLDDVPIIENMDIFDCPVCADVIQLGQGIMLRDCLHFLCKECLKKLVQTTDDALVRCPHLDDIHRCVGIIQDREIKAVVANNIYEKYLEKSIRMAETSMADSYHCKTPNCIGWCVYQPSSTIFECPICRVQNCIVCRVIHTNLTCNEYQEKQQNKQENDATEQIIKTQLINREIMYCPKCQALIEKTAGGGGCDGIKCSICHTEICWATRGPRWGPKGKGDISGGCRCKIDGQRCTPNCLGCH